MAELPKIGVIHAPQDFKYEEVLEEGKPDHEGDFFAARHPHMPYGRRAKIFAPFAALKGFEEEVGSKTVRYEMRHQLDAEELNDLNEKLQELQKRITARRRNGENRITAEVDYFVLCEDKHHEAYHRRGCYETVRDTVLKVDVHMQRLSIGSLRIPFADIRQIRLPKEDMHD